jgi:hypothetical protein
MSRDAIQNEFFSAAKDWICPGYGLLTRFLAIQTPKGKKLLAASLYFHPIPSSLHDFSFSAGLLCAGQKLSRSLTKDTSLEQIKLALRGQIEHSDSDLELPLQAGGVDYYSDLHLQDRWLTDLHLNVIGDRNDEASLLINKGVDHALRKADIPFDGLGDLCSWLEFDRSAVLGGSAVINIRVAPPVLLEFSECSLKEGTLTVALQAHSKFDVRRLSLAARNFPGKPAESRRQLGSKVEWGASSNGVKKGGFSIPLPEADRALVMLIVGDITAQRQWLADPKKTVNIRLLGTQFYDGNLKQLRQALLAVSDGKKFELAVASLLFILGFAPAVQIELDAPDLIVASPLGRLLVVECTTRIADFQAKLGKLVDRRRALTAALESTQHIGPVHAFLVCALPRDQIAANQQELVQRQIVLFCREEIEEALLRTNMTTDPDAALLELLAHAFPTNVG